MQATITDEGRLELEHPTLDDAKSFFEEARKTQGFYLVLDRQLEFFTRLPACARADKGFEFDFEAEVVQVYPVAGGFGTAFQLHDWNDARAAELEKKLKGRQRVLSESDLSPIHKIKKMNPNQRFILASKASRVERQILIRDSNPQVLMGLLNHPRIENKEVLDILKSHFATGGVMEQVARNRKWMQHPEIPTIIAKSNKTPQPLAIKLLDSLRTQDLRQMARNTGLREGIKRAALKLYTKRIGKS